MPSKFQEMLKDQRLNEETSRAGLKWEQFEDEQLMTMVSENVCIVDIAKTLQRSEGSIRTRLILYSINKVDKEGVSILAAANLVNLTEKDLSEYMERKASRYERKQNKGPSQKQPATVTNSDVYELLLTINKKIDELSR